MSKMKNMVIIKDINSNIIEEAIVVFKENIKIHEKNYIRNNHLSSKENSFKDELCVKEAETIISDYIDRMENVNKEERTKKKIKFLKISNVLLLVAFIIAVIM